MRTTRSAACDYVWLAAAVRRDAALRRPGFARGGATVEDRSSFTIGVANVRGPCSSKSIVVWYSLDAATVPVPYCGWETRSPIVNNRTGSPVGVENGLTSAPGRFSYRSAPSCRGQAFSKSTFRVFRCSKDAPSVRSHEYMRSGVTPTEPRITGPCRRHQETGTVHTFRDATDLPDGHARAHQRRWLSCASGSS